MIAIDWKPDAKALGKFGRSMLIFGLVFAAWFAFKGKPTLAWVCGTVGVLCFGSSIVAPPVARLFYVAWMALAWLLSQLITPIIMGALYYLVITPIGLLLRLTGHDRLRLRKPKGDSYWTECKASASYERQF